MRKIVLLAACVLAAGLSAGCAKKILLITQYPDGSPRVAEMEQVLKQRFAAEGVPTRFDVFNMNTVSRPNQVWLDERGKQAVARANALDPDVVFVAGDDAARYCAQRMVGMFREVVFFDVKGDPATYELAGQGRVTGVQEDVPVQQAFALLAAIAPKARGVAVLSDYSLEGDAIVAKVKAAANLPLRVTEIRRARTVQEWTAAVRDLQTKADALCLGGYSEVLTAADAFAALPPAEVLRLTAQGSRLPEVAFSADAVQGAAGALAAVYVPVGRQAQIAAEMAIDHLFHNKSTGDIQIVRSQEFAVRVSPERAAQLNVVLPPNPSEVLQKPAAAPVAPPAAPAK